MIAVAPVGHVVFEPAFEPREIGFAVISFDLERPDEGDDAHITLPRGQKLVAGIQDLFGRPALDLLEAFIGDLAQDGGLQPHRIFQLLLEELLVVGPVGGLVVPGEGGFDFGY